MVRYLGTGSVIWVIPAKYGGTSNVVRRKMKKRIVMLFLIGVTLVFGLLAVQQRLEAFGIAREQHLQRYPLTSGHVFYHIMITGVFALISVISGAVLYNLRPTR